MASIAEHEALVTATYSRRMSVRLPDGRTVSTRVKGKKLQPVCGDRVIAEPIVNEPDWLITTILPRRNTLARPDTRGKTEVLAANVDFIAVVASDPPTPDWFIVDRYLAAATLMGLPAAVLFNKIDLAEPTPEVTEVLAEYERVGYGTLPCSAKTGENLDRLQDLLQDRIAIIVGQSGVGKSSIINQLVSDADLRIGDVSDASGEGRHTTVNSVLLELPNGGAVIDSPGVRDYAPAIASSTEVMHGFTEIMGSGSECRFANCQHLREPGCAVKAGVESGRISARRYESYKRLQALTRRLLEGRN